MTSSRKTQQGASIWIILLVVIVLGFAGIFGLKLIPIYLEYYKIDKAMEGALQGDVANQNLNDIKMAIVRRMDIDDVRAINANNFGDFITITKKGNQVTVGLDYEAEEHLFGNLSVVARFEKVRTN